MKAAEWQAKWKEHEGTYHDERMPIYRQETMGYIIADLAACEAELVLANNTVTDIETRQASLSLANTQLRGALELASHELHHINSNRGTRLEVAFVVDSALAYPVDGLAEEVRKYMRHLTGCTHAGIVVWTTIRPECTCGLDALLSRLGQGVEHS